MSTVEQCLEPRTLRTAAEHISPEPRPLRQSPMQNRLLSLFSWALDGLFNSFYSKKNNRTVNISRVAKMVLVTGQCSNNAGSSTGGQMT